jgi:F-type H+-transporting ATPase subunit delta
MAVAKSAVRYAKALLELAIESNKIDVIEKDIISLLKASESTRELSIFLSSPLIKADKKNAIINDIFKQFDKKTLDFLSLIVNNGRDRIILEVANSFQIQLKEYRGIVTVEVVSATELSKKSVDAISKAIETHTKGKVELIKKINPNLIGGFLVRMGDYQIDASISSSLNKIKQELIK